MRLWPVALAMRFNMRMVACIQHVDDALDAKQAATHTRGASILYLDRTRPGWARASFVWRTGSWVRGTTLVYRRVRWGTVTGPMYHDCHCRPSTAF